MIKKEVNDLENNELTSAYEYKLLRKLSFFLALTISVGSTILLEISKTKIQKSNPFDNAIISDYALFPAYKTISSRHFLEDESIFDSVEYFKDSDENRKKAYLLYYSVIVNDYLNEEEKRSLKGAIEYFEDNTYLNYEYIYEQLSNIAITERNAKFPNTTISSQTTTETIESVSSDIYYRKYIELGNEKDLFHEVIGHGTSKDKKCKWLEEGLASIIDSEYNCILPDGKLGVDSYSLEANVIRYLCEIMGKEKGRECFFRIDAENYKEESAKDILTKYLNDAGIPEGLCALLYGYMDDYSLYRGKELTEEEKLNIEFQQAAIKEVLDTMNEISPINNRYIHDVLNRKIYSGDYVNFEFEKYYYFNSRLINEFPNPSVIKYLCCESELKNFWNNVDPTNNYLHITEMRIIEGENYFVVQNGLIDLCDKDKLIKIKEEYLENQMDVYVLKDDEWQKVEQNQFNFKR